MVTLISSPMSGSRFRFMLAILVYAISRLTFRGS